MLRPDIDRLVRRPRIEKPEEEFLLEAPRLTPAPPSPVAAGQPDPAQAPLSLAPALAREAAHLDALADRLVKTATPLSVPVPPEHQAALGPVVTTDQYVAAARARDPLSHSRRNLFEKSVLSGCGANPHWPLLLLPDVLDLRVALNDAVLSIQQTIPARVTPVVTPVTIPWSDHVSGSALADVHQELVAQSQAYRLKAGQSIQTMRADLGPHLLGSLLGPTLKGELLRIRPQIRETIQLLKPIRGLLCQSQLFLAFEHFQVRQVLSQLFVEAVENQLLHGLTLLLSRLQTTMIAPIVSFFERPETGLAGLLQEKTSRQVVGVVGATMAAMNQQYVDLAADLLRAQRQKSELRLHRLQVLGERSTVGRWMQQLDQVTTELERFLTLPAPTPALLALTRDRIAQPPAAPPHPLLDAYATEPALIADPTPFLVRELPFTGGDPGLTPAIYLGPDPAAGPDDGLLDDGLPPDEPFLDEEGWGDDDVL